MSPAVTYQYDEAGNTTKIIRGVDNNSAFTCDERDRLSGISHVVGGSPTGMTMMRGGTNTRSWYRRWTIHIGTSGSWGTTPTGWT
ncbi:MAG: hypothetical protein K6U00_13030, partial [Armatimonadetes bacterium]|nr:hypothetical protein [Armatimonadota bacterium]